MAVTINGYDGNPATQQSIDATPNNFIFGLFKLAFSGSYATGGDALDLSGVATLVPSLFGIITAFADGNGTGTQQSASGGYYQLLAGASPSAWKIKIFSAGGAELAAGAYPAAVTNDAVFLQVSWRKLA